MSFLGTQLRNLWSPAVSSGFTQSVRFKWTDWRMLRDYKRRQMMIKRNPERMRTQTIRKNDILPREIREVADQEMMAFPRDAARKRINERCCITSRPRGIVYNWRVSRIVFRHLADYNKLSGVQRGLW